MQRHILMIVNPHAGSVQKIPIKEAVKNAIDARGWKLRIFETTGETDEEDIRAEILSFQPWRILIAGGDGTINLVAKLLKDFDGTIGILPSGSANGLASNLKLPDVLAEQIDIALGDNLREIDHLNVNGETCLHISDLGINAELIKNFESSSIRGKLGYFLQSIPTLIESESPFDFTIEINGEEYIRSGILLAIANANQYGTGANINPLGKMDDGRFEVLIFKSLNFLEILQTIYDIADLDSDFAECFCTDHAIISSIIPTPFQIDGEPKGSVTRVEASLYPKKLKIAVP